MRAERAANGFLRPNGFEETKAWLQRKFRSGKRELAEQQRPPRPRSLFVAGRLSCDELIEGMQVGLHVAAGIWVGAVAAVRPRAVVLFPWGGGPPVSVARPEIRFALVVGQHTQAQREEIGRQQRQGVVGIRRDGRREG